MKSKILTFGTPLTLAVAYGYLFCFPQEASAAVIRGLRLCAAVVLPSLFPFIVLTNCVVFSGIADRILKNMHILRILHLDGNSASAMLLGLLGGYPLGAKTLASQVKARALTERQASFYLPLCNNGGAALFLAMIGSKLFGSLRIGVALYCIHVFSALLLSLLFHSKEATNSFKHSSAAPTSLHFVAAVHDAAATALTVSAFIVVFAVITQAVEHVPMLPPWITGMLELSGGCYDAVGAVLPLSLRASLCSLYAGWGGLCVHAQTAAVCEDIRIDFCRYFAIKLLHGLLAFGLTYFCFAGFS